MANSAVIAVIVTGILVSAILVGRWLRRLLPPDQLRDETRDTVKVTIGLVA